MKKVLITMSILVCGGLAKAQTPLLHFINNSFPTSMIDFKVYGNNIAGPDCRKTLVSGVYASSSPVPVDVFPFSATWTTTPTPPATQISAVTIIYNSTPPQTFDLSLCGLSAGDIINASFSGGFTCNIYVGADPSSMALDLQP